MSELALSNSFEYLLLWVYGHWKYFNSHSAAIDFRRQILMTKVDPRSVRFSGLQLIGHN